MTKVKQSHPESHGRHGPPKGDGDDRHHGGSGRGGHNPPDDHDHDDDDDDPEAERAANLEAERRRFAGSLPATPELYALAREQWYQLPGALVRPTMDTVPASSPDNDPPASKQDDGNTKGTEP